MKQVVMIIDYDQELPADICDVLADANIGYEGVVQVTVISGLQSTIRNREETERAPRGLRRVPPR